MDEKSKVLTFKIVIIVLHAVGIIGMSLEFSRPLFQWLTPLHLVVSAVILMYFHQDWGTRFWTFAGVSFGTGMLAEIIGVQTGLIFGEYQYGEVLGPKLLGVPLVIGLNWFMLVYITGGIFFTMIFNDHIAAVAGALLMVLMDMAMEPVAVQLGFWKWEHNHIPVSNYLGWFAVAFLLHLLYRKLKFRKQNVLTLLLFFNLILFFALLSFIL